MDDLVSTYVIPFTQFHLPNGRKTEEFYECNKALAQKAAMIIATGKEFQCEILSNGMCSFTVYDANSDVGDIAIELCSNTEEDVPNAITRLVESFDER